MYPPAYAAECPGAFDHLRLEGLAVDATSLAGTLRFLAPRGERHEAVEQRVELGPVPIGSRASVEFPGGRFTVRSEIRAQRAVARCCVHNTAEVAPGLGRAEALQRSLISTHVVLELSGGRFISPLEAGLESVNTYPVLATPEDDVLLGAAIILPDHPEIAPQSRGNLFDNTEIEEALLLHVQALSDAEREQAARQDPAVREMLARAMAVTPEEIINLHGGLRDG